MRAIERRVRALEESARGRWSGPLESLPTFEVARRGLFLIGRGAQAKKELEETGTELDPERRAELSKRLKVARGMAAVLAKYPAQEGVDYGDSD